MNTSSEYDDLLDDDIDEDEWHVDYLIECYDNDPPEGYDEEPPYDEYWGTVR
jgi:hypothetical protein